jgi:hypothetical protein
MKILLWLLTALLTSIPLLMYLAYSIRRLDTRRQLLLENLFSLELDDDYMKFRHGQHYDTWKSCGERKTKFEFDYFNKDFKAQTGHEDFFPPVALMTVFSGAGWYFVLSHVCPAAGLPELNQLVPETLAWGFLGAFFASMLAIIQEFREFNLTPELYYSLVYRLLFSSTTAFLVGQAFKDSFSSMLAFGVGLFPIEKTWDFVSGRTAKLLGAAKPERETGADLADIQGLEDSRDRQKLVSIGIASVQALATADPLQLVFLTTFPIRTVVDMIDKAILYLYIGDKVKELRKHGINGVIELVALAKLIDKIPVFASRLAPGGGNEFSKFFEEVNAAQLIKDVAKVLGQSEDELKAFIYNMYYDPVVIFMYDVWGRFCQPAASPLNESRLTTPSLNVNVKGFEPSRVSTTQCD